MQLKQRIHRFFFIPFFYSLIFLFILPGTILAGEKTEYWLIESIVKDENSLILASRLKNGRKSFYTVNETGQGFAHSPSISLDGTGKAAALWVRQDGVRETIMLSIFSHGNWSVPLPIIESEFTLTRPVSSFTRKGILWIAWTQFDGQDDEIHAATWYKGTLNTPSVISDNVYPDIHPSISAIGDSDATILWLGYDGNFYRLNQSSYSMGNWPEGTTLNAANEKIGFQTSFLQKNDGTASILSKSGQSLFSIDNHSNITKDLPSAKKSGPSKMALFKSMNKDTAAWAAWADPAAKWSGLSPFLDIAPINLNDQEIIEADAYPYDRSVIMSVGDSVTYGRGSSANGPPTDYLSRLKSLLKGPWFKRNKGIPGDTSIGVVNRIGSLLNNKRPGLTILMIGINDTILGISEHTILTNINASAQKVLNKGGHVLLSTTTPIIPGLWPIQYQRLSVLNPNIITVAENHDYPVVDLWKIFREKTQWQSKYMQAYPGVHPNDAGYDLMAKKFRLKILEMDLLFGDAQWIATDPLKPYALTEEDNTDAITWIYDDSSPLANDNLGAVAAVDLDGDGIDEIAAVFNTDGQQSFRIYSSPSAPSSNANVSQLVRDDWVYPGMGWITHIFGIDMEGDGIDEIGIISWHRNPSFQSLTIWRTHQRGVDTEPEAQQSERLVLDQWRIPKNGRVRDIAPIQVDEDSADEILVFTETDLTGKQKILIFDTPALYTDTEEENMEYERLYRNKWTLRKRMLRIIGQDIDEDGYQELVILRAAEIGYYDMLEAFSLPPLPANSKVNSAWTRISKDRWRRVSDPHHYSILDLNVNNISGGIRNTLGIWLNN